VGAASLAGPACTIWRRARMRGRKAEEILKPV